MSSRIRLCVLSFLSFVLSLALHSQTPVPAAASKSGATVPDKLLQTIKTQVSLDQGLNNPSGPRLRFVKLDDFNRDGLHYVRYRVYAEAAPVNTPLIVALWRIGTYIENIQILSHEAYVTSKGLLLLNKPKPGQEDAETVADGTELDVALHVAEGEPDRFVVRTKDSKVLIPGTLIPYPIESTGKTCKLRALLATPNAEAVLIYVDGRVPHSELPFQSSSEGELHDGKFIANAQGEGVTLVSPYVTGKDSGMLKFSVKSDDCTAAVEIPWGKTSYHPK